MSKVINLNQVMRLKFVLTSSYPEIFRRVLFLDKHNLYDIHRAIQIIFNWSGEKNHIFFPDNKNFCDFESEFKIKLKDINVSKFDYLYDKSWEVSIYIEDVLSRKHGIKYPYLIEGSQASPNEKCGSLNSYYNIISIINNSSHNSYFDIMEMFDNENIETYLDKDFINEEFKFF